MGRGAEKVATLIENRTGQSLTMKVGNPHSFVRLASVRKDGDYTVRQCMDWTYQEFVLEDQSDAAKKLFVNSDDCCDYERITVKQSHGLFFVETVARQRLWTTTATDEPLDATAAAVAAPPVKKEKMVWWRFGRKNGSTSKVGGS